MFCPTFPLLFPLLLHNPPRFHYQHAPITETFLIPSLPFAVPHINLHCLPIRTSSPPLHYFPIKFSPLLLPSRFSLSHHLIPPVTPSSLTSSTYASYLVTLLCIRSFQSLLLDPLIQSLTQPISFPLLRLSLPVKYLPSKLPIYSLIFLSLLHSTPRPTHPHPTPSFIHASPLLSLLSLFHKSSIRCSTFSLHSFALPARLSSSTSALSTIPLPHIPQ